MFRAGWVFFRLLGLFEIGDIWLSGQNYKMQNHMCMCGVIRRMNEPLSGCSRQGNTHCLPHGAKETVGIVKLYERYQALEQKL